MHNVTQAPEINSGVLGCERLSEGHSCLRIKEWSTEYPGTIGNITIPADTLPVFNLHYLSHGLGVGNGIFVAYNIIGMTTLVCRPTSALPLLPSHPVRL